MRAVIYLRQSLDKAGTELGIERQLGECERLCVERGYDVVQVIQDNNRSATSGDRPGYQELLKLIEYGQVDVVVVLRIDRLLRRLVDLEALIELSERTGVQIATVSGDIDLCSSSGRLIGRILASVARGEMETKSERHQLANLQKAQQGKPHGSRRPFGYCADLTTIHEPEAEILRAMADKVINGWSYKEVAWWLNEKEHLTTQGKLFYPVTVRNLLLKKRYGGIRDYKGTEFPGTWEPVFDPETWERLQLTMRLRQERSNVPQGRKYLLTGLLYCGICGMPLNGSAKRDRPGSPTRRMYRCRVQGDTRRDAGCGGVRRGAAALEDWITEAVFYRLETPALDELLQESDPVDGKLRHFLSVRHTQSLLLDTLVDDYATGLLTKSQFARAKATAEVELQRIELEIAQLNRGAISLPVGQTVRQAWESGTDSWRRELLRLLIKRIDVRPGNRKPFYTLRDGTVARFDPSLVDVFWLA